MTSMFTHRSRQLAVRRSLKRVVSTARRRGRTINLREHPLPEPILAVRTGNYLGCLGEMDLRCFSALRLRHEAGEALPFLGQGSTVLLRQWFEGLDEQDGAAAVVRDLPCAPDEAACEHGRLAQVGSNPFAVLVGDDAAAVGVGQQQVVELGQKPWRSRGGGIG